MVCTTPRRGFYRLPVNGCRSLTTHHYLRQPLQAVVPVTATEGDDGGTINVNDGKFYGWHNDDDDDLPKAQKSGPASHYGLKVVGGTNVNIYGGVFDGGNGGAFVTGINNFESVKSISSTNGKYANVKIYAGIFGDNTSDEPNNEDAFNVYDMSNVVFGAWGGDKFDTPQEYLQQIVLYAQNATIATNPITNGGDGAAVIKSIVNVYYGHYSNGDIGVWNANTETLAFYNTGTGHTSHNGAGTLPGGMLFYTG